jgi:hypothetical protein
METIALSHFDFRSAGSLGANETANWIKGQFESIGLDAWLESFSFTGWNLLGQPSLIVDQDGNSNTRDDQVSLSSFQCEHYSWSTSGQGVFSDLVILPLPPAADHTQLGINPIDHAAWDAINTTGKILLIGREVRMIPAWVQAFTDKLAAQTPAVVVYTWWYNWMSFCPPFFSSAGGVPLNGRYYWNLGIPVGFVGYEDGLWIRSSETANASVAANVTIRSVISNDAVHYNVVGRISGFQNPEKIVIVSSHYDTVMCSGFCDNGAGTAGVVELAKVITDAIQQNLYKPKYTLLFVAFTGEELYLAGSASYVKQHKSEMANIIGIINLDCIGSDDLYVTQTPGSSLEQTIVQAAQDLGISITVEPTGGSDHESFRSPSDINYVILASWGIDLNISDAMPVASSAMLDSYPLFYNNLWDMGKAGWIHTSYDNSTSDTNSWVEVADLGNHIKVAAVAIMRLSPNTVPEFSLTIVLALLLLASLFICILARRKPVC